MDLQQQNFNNITSDDIDYSFRSIEQEYVTTRKRRRSLSQNETRLTSQSSFDSRYSLPELSMRGRDLEIESLKNEIQELKEKLESANNEVDNLSIEVMTLKSVIQKKDKKTELYKNMYVESMTSSKKKIYAKKSRVDNDADQDNILDITYKELNITKPIQHHDSIDLKKANGSDEVPETCSSTTSGTKSKIMIISSNKRNKIRQMVEQTFESFDVCHFLTPNVGIRVLLRDINTKLETFTHQDYCVLFIGEEDFRTSNDYKELVAFIRETLTNLNHTNIILCLPTFKCGKTTNIYNRRIETFNSYLYQDTQRYEYAYLLDANLNLTYDWRMFSGRWGILNNRGMKTIISDLGFIIRDLDMYNTSTNNTCSITPHSDKSTDKSTDQDKLQIDDSEKQQELFQF